MHGGSLLSLGRFGNLVGGENVSYGEDAGVSGADCAGVPLRRCRFRALSQRHQCRRGCSLCGSAGATTVEDEPGFRSSSLNQSRGGLALRPGMMASPICGWHEALSEPCLPLWRFQSSPRPMPCATMILSAVLAEKTRRQLRQGSLPRPHPIGRGRVVLSRDASLSMFRLGMCWTRYR